MIVLDASVLIAYLDADDSQHAAALPFPADAPVALARLRATTRLKMPDCCVLLTAEDAGARVASFDARLAQAAEDRALPALRR